MNHSYRIERVSTHHRWSALLSAVLALIATSAVAFEPAAEGWSRWRVQTVVDAPAWCCFDHRDGAGSAVVCELDRRNHGYSSQPDSASSGEAFIYARMDGGRLTRLRALGSSCPVQASTPIADMGAVDANVSARWLADHLQPRSSLSSDLYSAIALHAGEQAGSVLFDAARAAPQLDDRKDALFWLGQTRAGEAAPLILQLMNDSDVRLREHVAFVVANSAVPGNIDALIRQGSQDVSTKVRGQAWFWLAQTADQRTEAAIGNALENERDRQVREQMIFALSQLPDERASAALIALVNDRGGDRATREQALFWLGQSDSDSAQSYLEAVLVGE
jgi:hypothetical protein